MNLNLKSPPGQVTVQSLVLINNPITPHRYYIIDRSVQWGRQENIQAQQH